MNGLLLTFRGSFTFGLTILYICAISFGMLGRFYNFFCEITQSGVGSVVKYLFFGCIFACVFMTSYLLSFAKNTVKYDEDAIIVLGCGLNKDGTPADALKNRLDASLTYLEKNTSAFVVVSGGHSRNSPVEEGYAMREYLLNKGVDPNRILCEINALSTRENFIFSKKLMEEKGISTDNIAFVTNSFHVYRAGIYAKSSGFKSAKAVSAKTNCGVFLPSIMREIIAVLTINLFANENL
ncbi:MAG: YdcF family protein [Oscillospiraceae bacterium]